MDDSMRDSTHNSMHNSMHNSNDNSFVISDSQRRENALIAYILLIIGLFTGIPILFAAIWAMVKKNSSYGTLYYSHLVNTTRVFWWSLFWTIVGCLTLFIGVGFLVLAATWIWAFYRTVTGLAKVLGDQAYPL